MNIEENNRDTNDEALEPDWVNHWHEDNDKKEPNTKQTTF
jgi:hypothetical protein